MKKYFYILAGGAAGATLRFLVNGRDIKLFMDKFPTGTFIVNIAGAFLLAFFLRWASKKDSFNENLHYAIAPGFLDAFTTFSTLCKETTFLIIEANYSLVFFYLFISIFAGLSISWLGFTLSGWSRGKI